MLNTLLDVFIEGALAATCDHTAHITKCLGVKAVKLLNETNRQLFDADPIDWVTEAPSPWIHRGTARLLYPCIAFTGWCSNAGWLPTSSQNLSSTCVLFTTKFSNLPLVQRLFHRSSGKSTGTLIGATLPSDPFHEEALSGIEACVT